MKWFLLVMLCLFAGATRAGPADCDHQQAKAGARVFHIDPARGAVDGDGSAQSPWRSLAEVLDPARGLIATRRLHKKANGFTAEPAGAGPIHPGDVLELANGDYGDIRLTGYANSETIAIVAAPDQKPVVHGLWIAGAAHWLLRGLTFAAQAGESGPANAIVEVVNHDSLGPSDHIAFIDNLFLTRASVDDWSPADWVNRPKAYGLVSQARCSLLRGNLFHHLRNGLSVGGDDSLIEDNVIHDFGNDALDFYASGLVIRHNRIFASRHSPAELLHPDAIQGWALPGKTNRDDIIDGNVIANLNPADDNEMQGISIFTDRWDGVTVENNAVATNAWHGIALYGVKNAKVLNNTLVATRPGRKDSWILIHDSADHAVRGDALVRNNIATAIVVEASDVTLDHNLTARPIRLQKDARAQELGGEQVAPLAGQFRHFDPAAGAADLHLAADSVAARAGIEAPDLDAEGRRRAAPFDLGAYARP